MQRILRTRIAQRSILRTCKNVILASHFVHVLDTYRECDRRKAAQYVLLLYERTRSGLFSYALMFA